MRRGLGLIVVVCGLASAPALARIPVVGIPSQPGQGGAPEFIGSPARALPLRSFDVPQHPFMSANGTSNIHNDAYMTDAYRTAGPLGRAIRVRSTWLGLEECASITFDSKDRIVALCGSLDGARLRLLDPVTLETLSLLQLPPRSVRPGTTPLNDYCAAGYFYLDHLDRGVLSTNLNQIWIVGVTERVLPLFTIERVIDLSLIVPAPDCLVSVLPDWSGRLWFLSRAGIVGTVHPMTGVVHRIDTGELMANSFAVDDTGGVFIVSERALYRFDAALDGSPVVTWRVAYDRGSQVKPGMLSQGSGTSPTLIGADFVAIADNAEPRMNIEVYRRWSGALVCREPVFEAGASATENSLIAVGHSLIAENNYGYTSPTITAGGGSTTPGLARVDFNPVTETCSTVWTSTEIAPTTVAKASLGSGLIYTYTKAPDPGGTDAWYFTAIDVRTGETAFKRLTGYGYLYNNHYAPISIGPDGAAYIGALGGLIRVEDGRHAGAGDPAP